MKTFKEVSSMISSCEQQMKTLRNSDVDKEEKKRLETIIQVLNEVLLG